MRPAFLVAARRTAVAPRRGAFQAVESDELGAVPIRAVLADTGMAVEAIDDVIFGNALYGGGNPARLAALRAGLPDHVPALTIDTQCCGGLDAIMVAAERMRAEVRTRSSPAVLRVSAARRCARGGRITPARCRNPMTVLRSRRGQSGIPT